MDEADKMNAPPTASLTLSSGACSDSERSKPRLAPRSSQDP